MARLFVYSDNLAARAELRTYETDDGETAYAAFCAGCSRGSEDGIDLLADSRERWHPEDAQQATAIHVDSCKRCADPNCLTRERHDAGRRCRIASLL